VPADRRLQLFRLQPPLGAQAAWPEVPPPLTLEANDENFSSTFVLPQDGQETF